MKKKSQNEEILEFLHTHKGITSIQAFHLFGITRLSARIHDLRDRGYEIMSCDIEVKDRHGDKTKVSEYRLVKEVYT